MKDLLQRLHQTRVLVVGDLMMDAYIWGEVERVSPEAPVPVVKVRRDEFRLGGAANVVNNLAALGCKVAACGVVGDDDMGLRLGGMLEALGASRAGLMVDRERPTIVKTRIMAKNQQMLRYDREDASGPSPAVARRLINFLKKNLQRYDGVIVSDYGKGLVTPELMKCLTVGKGKPPVFVDPKGMDYAMYRGVACLTPNSQEAALASRIPITGEATVLRAGRALMKQLGLKQMCVTRGAAGVLALNGRDHRMLPARAREVFDVTGAGDTFISVSGALSFSGQPFFDCVEVANVAAGVVVGKLGTATATPHEILSAAKDAPKFYTLAEIGDVAEALRAQSRRIVFTNGCFDLLHAGHIQYLQASRDLGDLLIVGINSDASVRRLKGKGRPMIGEEDRAQLLGALACVDYVVVFEQDEPLELIRRVRPHVLTKGADYTVQTVVGHKDVKKWGGEVRLIPLVENRSTTDLIDKIAGSALNAAPPKK